MPLRGTLPLTASGSSKAGSVVMLARPLTRKVSLTPGTKKISPTPGRERRLPIVSTRLLPSRSGISRVSSSITLTNPVAAPRRVAGGDHQKRRQRDEGAGMLFEPRQLLLDRALHRLAVDFTDLADV